MWCVCSEIVALVQKELEAAVQVDKKADLPRLPEELASLMRGWRPNFALLNFYAHGEHWMNWHQDRERALGPHSLVVSLSVGVRASSLLSLCSSNAH